MNILSREKQVAAISALSEGASIRSIERMTGIHRDTIMRLGVRVGQSCARLMDESMHDLPCQDIQVDEMWGYVGKKKRVLTPEDEINGLGDAWTFVALDGLPCRAKGEDTPVAWLRSHALPNSARYRDIPRQDDLGWRG